MIVFVDDEPGPADIFLEELRDRGFDVQLVLGVSECLEFLGAGQNHPECWILDVMMDPGSLGEGETQGGLRTGLILHERIRERFPHSPIFVLTANTDPYVGDSLARDAATRVAIRTDIFYDEFCDMVESTLRIPGA